MGDLGIALQRNDRDCGVDDGDLAGDFSLIARRINNLVGDRVLPGLGNVEWVVDRNIIGDIDLRLVDGGGTGVHELRVHFKGDFGFALERDDRKGCVDDIDRTGLLVRGIVRSVADIVF